MRHKFSIALSGILLALTAATAQPKATYVETPYEEPRAVFDFFLDDPRKINVALFWIRSLINPLLEDPYGFAPEFMDIKVVVHGTEIVTLARHNYDKYRDAVERMRYYAALGVEFRVCAIAAADYGYALKDFYDFVMVAPSAITELVHWQQQGYGLITPVVVDRKLSLEEIR